MRRKISLDKQATKLSRKTLNRVFWRSLTLSGTWNFVNGQGVAISYMMMPALYEIYPDKKDEDKLKDALKRHMAYFNVTPAISTFPISIALSMEEEMSQEETTSVASINAIKASLMGPLSGIGDSFFWGTFRVIASGIGIALAAQGSLLGPALFLLLYNIPHIITRLYGAYLGYDLGGQFIKKAYENGIMNILTRSATILGLVMMGAMIYGSVPFQTTFAFSMRGMEYNLQSILDDILLGLLPLIATISCFSLVRKKVNANVIILGILLLSFVLSVLGIA